MNGKRSGSSTKRHFALGAAASLLAASAAMIGSTPGWAGPASSSLDALSSEQLIRELSTPNTADPNRGTAVAAELMQRHNLVDHRTIIAALVDEGQPTQTRELMVDLLAESPSQAPSSPEELSLLADERLDHGLKARILTRFSFGRADAPLLHNLVVSNTDLLSFHALKALSNADPTDAIALSWEIVKSAPAQTDLRLSAAYKTLIRCDGIIRPADSKMLADHLTKTMNDSTSSADLKDAAFFALSEMRSPSTLRAIMSSKGLDPSLVGGAIDENAAMLLEQVRNSPDEATVAFVVSAMELHPVFEFATPLEAAMKRVTSKGLRLRIQALVRRIPVDGVPLNAKWTED